MCVLLGFAQSSFCADPASLWGTRSSDDEVSVNLYFFWTTTCPHCTNARPFVDDLVEQNPWIVLKSYELNDAASGRRFVELANRIDEQATSVPAFVFCGRMLKGFDSPEGIGAEVASGLKACKRALLQGSPIEVETGTRQTRIEIPWFGESDISSLSLPLVTVLLSALDSFNPCAFFVLLFLLSMLVNAKSRRRMLLVGTLFVSISGVAYFLFIVAWLNIFLVVGELVLLTVAAGLIAIFIAVLNIKDYIWSGRGPSLGISADSKRGLFKRMRDLVAADSWVTLTMGTLALALIANAYELLCTAGLPMVFTRIITLNDLSIAAYYGYVALYCTVYILPLLTIVLLFVFTLGRRKLSEYEGRLLKLLSGVMMGALGVVLLSKPESLSNVGVMVSLIMIALLITFIAHLLQRSKQT